MEKTEHLTLKWWKFIVGFLPGEGSCDLILKLTLAPGLIMSCRESEGPERRLLKLSR